MPLISIRFDVNDNNLRDSFFEENLSDAIAGLGEATQPEWGNLTAQHMVEHLSLGFEISNGKIEFACLTPPEKLDRMRAFLYSKQPIPRGFLAPFIGSKLPALKFGSLAEAKGIFLEEVNVFLNTYKFKSPGKTMNPVFGLLGIEDWHRHHYKHCYHHLLQFNLIEEVE